MSPKEKAQELKDKFYLMMPTVESLKEERVSSIKYSILCVNEITRENLEIDKGAVGDSDTIEILNNRYSYWKEVMKEFIECCTEEIEIEHYKYKFKEALKE